MSRCTLTSRCRGGRTEESPPKVARLSRDPNGCCKHRRPLRPAVDSEEICRETYSSQRSPSDSMVPVWLLCVRDLVYRIWSVSLPSTMNMCDQCWIFGPSRAVPYHHSRGVTLGLSSSRSIPLMYHPSSCWGPSYPIFALFSRHVLPRTGPIIHQLWNTLRPVHRH